MDTRLPTDARFDAACTNATQVAHDLAPLARVFDDMRLVGLALAAADLARAVHVEAERYGVGLDDDDLGKVA